MEKLEPRPRWQRTLTFALRFVCAALVLAFLCEGYVRVRPWIKTGIFWRSVFWGTDQTYKTDPKTGLRVLIPYSNLGPVHINSHGFRSPEIAVEKPAGRLRLAFLGGSTTFCAEVSSDQMTWPYLVVAAIQKRYPDLDIDFINGAVPGYSTAGLKPYFERHVARFHPDVIVIYEGANDLSANSYTLAREQGVTSHTVDQSMGWLARHSMLVYLIEKNLQILELQHEVHAQQKIVVDQTRMAAMYRKDLAALVEASKQVASLVVTVTFSPRVRAGQSPAELRTAAFSSLYYMPYLTPEAILEGFQSYNQVMRSVAAGEDTLLIGDEDSIPADAIHYRDSAHFTDAGSMAMANRVADSLLRSPRFLTLVAEHTHSAAAGASQRQ
jgi:lysophospholipase L1-like esterase